MNFGAVLQEVWLAHIELLQFLELACRVHYRCLTLVLVKG
jgi:hypothetical protein